MASGLSDDQLRVVAVKRLEKSTSTIPPCLFRAYSCERSRGVNNEHEMFPMGLRKFPRRSLFAGSRSEIKTMLRPHLLWDYNSESDFISWSSSILWVLEYAARMHSYEKKTNIHIAIMDTRKVGDMAIFPATTLMEVCGLPECEVEDKWTNKLQQAYYTSEYLFCGPIRNNAHALCYKAVRWEHVCAADVHNLLGAFSGRSSSDYKLFLRIAELHPEFDIGTSSDLKDLVPLVVLIAALFGNEFQVVVTVALTTLLRGQQMPRATELGQILEDLRSRNPVDMDSIVKFDFLHHVDAGLTEGARMYETLRDVLMPEVEARREQDLAVQVASLSVQG